ncbi:hypothetical protein BgiBS90_034844, partial [Biomphalaria glabrata]
MDKALDINLQRFTTHKLFAGLLVVCFFWMVYVKIYSVEMYDPETSKLPSIG